MEIPRSFHDLYSLKEKRIRENFQMITSGPPLDKTVKTTKIAVGSCGSHVEETAMLYELTAKA